MRNFFFCLLICLFCTGLTEAKFTQNFEKKGLVPKSVLKMNSQVQRTLTIGKVSEKSVLKYGTFDEYWKVCKTQATGKGFEALAIETYNKGTPFVRRSLCTTVALKSPHDAVDVLKFDKITRRIQGKFQLKSGYSSAKDAVTKSKQIVKYADCTIVTTSDVFAEIKNDLDHEITKKKALNKPISLEWQRIDNAIRSGKLTASIDGVVMPTLSECVLYTNEIKRLEWDEMLKRMRPLQTKIVLNKQTVKFGITATRFIAKNIFKTSGKYVTKSVIMLGYGYSVYEIYGTWADMSHGRLDRDIAVARIGNTAAQIAFETMGPVILTTLSVPGGGWIAGGIMAAGTAGFIVVDMWISNVQSRRNVENRCLLKQIDLASRCEAARKVLLSTI